MGYQVALLLEHAVEGDGLGLVLVAHLVLYQVALPLVVPDRLLQLADLVVQVLVVLGQLEYLDL